MLSLCVGQATAADSFYEGKKLDVIINYGAGGNTDITARALMQFMQKHIAGEPRITIKNKPGAGGIVGTNYFGAVSKPNGLTAGVFSVALMPELMKDPALTVSHNDFIFVGGIPEDTIYHSRKVPGLEKATDLFNLAAPIKTAGHGPVNMKDLMLRAAMDLLEVDYKHVTGFKSSGKIRAAILKSDVDMSADSMTGYASRVGPNLVDEGHSIPLFSIGVPTDDGQLGRAPGSLESVPTFDEFYEAKFGKKPSGQKYDVLRTIALIRATSLRAVFLPKGTPPEAVKSLRAAFDSTTADPDYRAEFLKISGFDLTAISGVDAQVRLKSLLNTDAKTVAFIKRFAAEGSN
ncbi:hypothetical protein DKT75_20750 [Leucothrix arctica]|uniref:Tripartite tricarboxylate transporter substrate binding protein n=2 Tax=Leucothrix arctica TaxID=1481894 RepID=A0A317C4J6_9GAMM|nr:hypothetical protein DKT75_20750 [Leucothrix arctica]